MKKINGIMMQYFEWYLDCKQNLWNEVKENAEELAKKGIRRRSYRRSDRI